MTNLDKNQTGNEVVEEVANVSTLAVPEENETKQKSGTYVHKFKKTFEYEGNKYETINFYFDKLRGVDIIAVEDEMAALNKYVLTPEISSEFLIKVAARAGGIGSDAIARMPIGDFMAIKNAARGCLMSLGL